MIDPFYQLLVLFFVIFDPLASFVVFTVATNKMQGRERKIIALIAVLVAASLSLLVLIFGQNLLDLFNTKINEFQIAGGIILGILGVKMVLGYSLTNIDQLKNNSGWAVASIIGTPLLTGPAAITSIILSAHDYGRAVTGSAIGVVLLGTAVLFYNAERVGKVLGKILIQVISTILGLITLSWGVKYILQGLAA
ncbi:MarC family protein [Candidatus Woesearchaeota archaeon]|nr:MarC family protein [Candidatus Woesearchaeota archaeon]